VCSLVRRFRTKRRDEYFKLSEEVKQCVMLIVKGTMCLKKELSFERKCAPKMAQDK